MKKTFTNKIKKVTIIIFQIIAFLTFGYFFNDDLVKTEHETDAFDFLAFACYLLMLAITFSWAIFEVIRDYKKNKIPFGLVSIFVGIFVCFFLYSTYFEIKKLDSSPVYLKAIHESGNEDSGITNATLKFRKDNTYLLSVDNFLGSSHFRGIYSIQDNLIMLDKDTIGHLIIKSRRLLIKKNPNFGGFIIHQVNENMNVIKYDVPFIFKNYDVK